MDPAKLAVRCWSRFLPRYVHIALRKAKTSLFLPLRAAPVQRPLASSMLIVRQVIPKTTYALTCNTFYVTLAKLVTVNASNYWRIISGNVDAEPQRGDTFHQPSVYELQRSVETLGHDDIPRFQAATQR